MPDHMQYLTNTDKDIELEELLSLAHGKEEPLRSLCSMRDREKTSETREESALIVPEDATLI